MRLDRTKHTPCRTDSRPRDLNSAGSQITRTIAAISAAGLIIASAGFGAVFAFGLGIQHGLLLASLTVLMAVALELAKPLAVASALAAFRSWRTVMRGLLLSLLAVVAIGYSVTAELQLIAGSRGELVAKREAAIEGHSDRRESVKQARAELVTLAPSRTPEEVKADVVKLLAAHPKANGCRDATAGATARFVCPKVAALNGEIARAKRRAELQDAISKGQRRPTQQPPSSTPTLVARRWPRTCRRWGSTSRPRVWVICWCWCR